MVRIGCKLQKQGVIMVLLLLVLMNAGCEERFDHSQRDRDEKVAISLSIGFAEEVDGYTLSASSSTKSTTKQGGFDYNLQPSLSTKSSGFKPDNLYNLEIVQYDSNGNYKARAYLSGSTSIGSYITVGLETLTDCQLVLVAWGEGNTKTLGTSNLATAQKVSLDASVIKKLDPTAQSDMNKMPYVLHLEHVNITKDGTNGIISSLESRDVRLLLRRLASRLTLDWSYSYTGYTLKQILLESIPLNYNVVAQPDNDKTYPSLLDQFTTIQLTEAEITAGRYSCWIPANVRGSSSSATSQTYRIKSNAPTGSAYASFIAGNTSDPKKKLNYRVYLGSNNTSDFNLYSNTDYNYIVTVQHTGLPVDDRRVTIIDPIPASESNNNLVPTANCFMVAPGGAFCFNPYKYYIGGAVSENSILQGWCSSVKIQSVKVLWQTKENGDVGDPVLGVVNSSTDHTNIVDLKDGDSFADARIYCRTAPNTTGGSGLIAAYDDVNGTGNILWSWHVWVTDYTPENTGNQTVLEPENKRKFLLYKNNNGTIQQSVMMDRNLGAYTGYVKVPGSILEMSKANGFHYQKGRKDPFPGSYTSESLPGVYNFILSRDYPPKHLLNRYEGDGITWIIPVNLGYTSLRNAYQHPISIAQNNGSQWCSDNPQPQWGETKTFNDPCPAGWRVPGGSELKIFVEYNQSALLPDLFTNAKANGGLLLKYDETENRTYIRFTGYPPNQAQLNYVGTNGYMTAWDRSTVFTVTTSNVATGSMRDYDAHTTRCVQERK